MGCAQSKVDNEESVARCKQRKILMKEAVAARNAFAAGHSGYAVSLKNTGAALSDYALGEAEETSHLHQPPLDASSQPPPPPPPPPPPSIDTLPLPPPPLPNFSPSPIKRAVSMPEIPTKQNQKPVPDPDSITAVEEEEEEEDEVEEHDHLDHRVARRKSNNRISKDLNGSRAPPNVKVGPESTPQSPPMTPESHAVPPMPEAKNMAWDYFFMVDNMPGPSLEAEDEVARNDGSFDNVGARYGRIGIPPDGGGADIEGVEPKTPEQAEEKLAAVLEEDEVEEEKANKGKQIDHSKTAPTGFMMVGKREASIPSVNLMQVLNAIDDHFLKASESAQEVCKMLEATRLHYHANFADNRGHIDHSARVMRVITWNKSFRGISSGESGKDDFDSDDYETHATVLDKLFAWEKKLYDEVKQGELMKLEYKKKVALLNKQKKRGANAESLEKTKAAVSHLHTIYIVDMQSMDSTVSEVNHIRDNQLYPKLVALVDGMAKMWASMCIHHDSQLKIVTELKSLDVSHNIKETTEQHHGQTVQLGKVVEEWHLHFEKLVTHQKKYIQTLNSWLKLNLIPIESSLKEKISSPPRVQDPPIRALLHAWHDHLAKLPDELAKSAISSFAAMIKTIINLQEDEIKLKEKCDETRKEFLRKKQSFEEWYQKHMLRRNPADERDAERGEVGNPNDPVSERRFAVESLNKKLEEDVEAHRRHCLQVREKSLGTLKIRLPEIFRALSDHAQACSDAYERLRSITRLQNAEHGLPH